MKHALVAAILAGVAISASARDADFTIGVDQACPAGTVSQGPAYHFEHGRLVRDGWVCTDRQGRN
jgi:hypothetical protein